MDLITKRAEPAGSQMLTPSVTPAEHLMLTPFADWPPEALGAARTLVESPLGLAALRSQPCKKAWVAQWALGVMAKGRAE